MPSEFNDRRLPTHIDRIVDEALGMATSCGWRYALAYLIRENVSAEVIQRMLSGRRMRAPRSASAPDRPGLPAAATRADTELLSLLNSLAQRRPPACKR